MNFLVRATAALVFWTFSVPLEAQIDRPAVRVCFEPWPPYIVTSDDNTPPSGPVIELVRTIATKMDRPVSFQRAGFQRCLNLARSQKIDIVTLVDANTRDVIMSDVPLVDWTIVAFVRAGDGMQTASGLESLTGKRVATFSNYVYPPAVEDSRKVWGADFSIPFDEHADSETGRIFRLLEVGRVDVALVDAVWARLIGAQQRYRVKPLAPPLVREESGLGYASKSPTIRAFFEAELKKMSAEGKLLRMMRLVQTPQEQQ